MKMELMNQKVIGTVKIYLLNLFKKSSKLSINKIIYKMSKNLTLMNKKLHQMMIINKLKIKNIKTKSKKSQIINLNLVQLYKIIIKRLIKKQII